MGNAPPSAQGGAAGAQGSGDPQHRAAGGAGAAAGQYGYQQSQPGGGAYGGSGPHASFDQQAQQQQQQKQQQQQSDAQKTPNLHRSNSDTSMTIMDENTIQQAVAGSSQTTAAIENILDDDTVPTVFRWEHGGRQVYITGTFNGWSRQIPMHRSGNDFTYIHNLKRGKHAFKFIVDDEWRFAPDQPTVADIEGRINNFIDVTGFKAYTGDRDFEKEKAAAAYGAVAGGDSAAAAAAGQGASSTQPGEEGGDLSDADHHHGATGMGSNKPDQDGEVFLTTFPDVDDYTKEPPPLPPHLRHIILNKPPQLQDTAALPVPQHVALNHLYCTAIKDNMMVLGITQRYKTKFCTTVYYSPCASK